MLSDKLLDAISIQDFEQLLTNGIAESRTLEYKQELPSQSDEDKREFLADVSAFANAGGGDLVFGAEEKRDDAGKPTGTLERIDGLETDNIDQAILRLDSSLRDGLAPRIAGVQFKVIPGFPKGPVLLVRVPRSWAAPHMVVFKNLSRFFFRSSAAKHQLDVLQIRDAFMNSRSAAERAAEFRLQRLSRVASGDAAVPLSSSKVFLFHAVPHGSLFGAVQVDLARAKTHADFKPIDARGWNSRFNIDGVITLPGRDGQGPATSYMQLFRNGIIEAAYSEVYFNPKAAGFDGGIAPGVSSADFLKDLLDLAQRVQRLYGSLEVAFPVSVFVSLCGMKGVTFHATERGSGTFDRDIIALPDVTMSEPDSPVDEVAQPLMDILWQAAGFERCFAYPDRQR